MGDFNGEISVKSTRSNNSYNSSVLNTEGLNVTGLRKIPEVEGVQKYVTVNGILRTEDNFAGIIFKGIGKDFDHESFKKFLLAGKTPLVTENGFNSNVTVSQKIANDLHKKIGDSVVAIFSKEGEKPLYRKFKIVGIYKTDIKMIDELYILGGINHARKVLGIKNTEVGGLEIFLKKPDDIDKVFPDVEKNIGYKNYAEKVTEKYPQIVDWINIFDTNIALIITIMLVVVIINIVMVLLILIIERTNSIGMLKTLGASNRQIQMIFINYTLLIMVPGMLIGNIVGIGLLLLQKFLGIIKLNPENYYVSEVPVDLNPVGIFLISFGILFSAALSLLLPSLLISKISPLKAIKYD